MGIKENKIVLISDNKLEDEQYRIEVSEPEIKVSANSDLGFVYGLSESAKNFCVFLNFGFGWSINLKKGIYQHTLADT